MQYPAIVYHRAGGEAVYADDLEYQFRQRYTITVIDRDPDSEIAANIRRNFRYCSSGTPYTADNLHHEVLTLYY